MQLFIVIVFHEKHDKYITVQLFIVIVLHCRNWKLHINSQCKWFNRQAPQASRVSSIIHLHTAPTHPGGETVGQQPQHSTDLNSQAFQSFMQIFLIYLSPLHVRKDLSIITFSYIRISFNLFRVSCLLFTLVKTFYCCLFFDKFMYSV